MNHHHARRSKESRANQQRRIDSGDVEERIDDDPAVADHRMPPSRCGSRAPRGRRQRRRACGSAATAGRSTGSPSMSIRHFGTARPAFPCAFRCPRRGSGSSITEEEARRNGRAHRPLPARWRGRALPRASPLEGNVERGHRCGSSAGRRGSAVEHVAALAVDRLEARGIERMPRGHAALDDVRLLRVHACRRGRASGAGNRRRALRPTSDCPRHAAL